MIQAASTGRQIAASQAVTSVVRDRIEQLLRTEFEFVTSKSFQEIDRELEQEVFSSACRHEPAPNSVPANLPGHLARLCETGVLAADQERELFRRLNYLKYRANMLRSRLDSAGPDLDLLAQVERFLEAAQNVRNRLIRANMRLAISVVKKFVSSRHSFDDLLSDGICSLMHAVDKFDYERGFRFSTYAYRAIARNAYRGMVKAQKEQLHFSGEMDEAAFESTTVDMSLSMDVKFWGGLRGTLTQMMHRLDRREQLIIRARYALGPHRKVKTFQAIAQKLGVSKERVRQLEQRAMNKLRSMAAELDLDKTVESSLL